MRESDAQSHSQEGVQIEKQSPFDLSLGGDIMKLQENFRRQPSHIGRRLR
jgi:hypothetical protein